MLYMLYICNISFYISSRNAFLPSLDNPVFQLEGKYTEWPNPQIRGENRQSGLTD